MRLFDDASWRDGVPVYAVEFWRLGGRLDRLDRRRLRGARRRRGGRGRRGHGGSGGCCRHAEGVQKPCLRAQVCGNSRDQGWFQRLEGWEEKSGNHGDARGFGFSAFGRARRRGVLFKSLRLCKRQRAWRRETPGGLSGQKPGSRRLGRPQNGGCCAGATLARISLQQKGEQGEKSQKKKAAHVPGPRKIQTSIIAKWGGGEWSWARARWEGCSKQGGYARMVERASVWMDGWDGRCGRMLWAGAAAVWMLDGRWISRHRLSLD